MPCPAPHPSTPNALLGQTCSGRQEDLNGSTAQPHSQTSLKGVCMQAAHCWQGQHHHDGSWASSGEVQGPCCTSFIYCPNFSPGELQTTIKFLSQHLGELARELLFEPPLYWVHLWSTVVVGQLCGGNSWSVESIQKKWRGMRWWMRSYLLEEKQAVTGSSAWEVTIGHMAPCLPLAAFTVTMPET